MSKPKPTAPRVTLATAHFLELAQRMAARSVDHTLTDPPYLEHTHESQRRGGGRPGKRGAVVDSARPLDFTHLTPEARIAYATQIARITRRWALVFTDVEGFDGWRLDLEAAGMVYVRQLVWVRGTLDLREGAAVVKGRKGSPQFTGDRPAQGHEAIVLAHAAGARLRWNGRHARTDGTGGLTGGGTVYTTDIVTKDVRLHSAQKPLPLMRELVRDFTSPGETIFDPFAGSGTTLLAAVLEGRRAEGCEVIPRHAASARARVEAAL